MRRFFSVGFASVAVVLVAACSSTVVDDDATESATAAYRGGVNGAYCKNGQAASDGVWCWFDSPNCCGSCKTTCKSGESCMKQATGYGCQATATTASTGTTTAE